MTRRRRCVAALVSLALVAGAAMAVGAPAASAKGYDIKTESYEVKTKYGHLFVEVARPVDPKDSKKVVKGPAILTYTPYSILYGGARTGDADHWVPRGYVRVVADVVGTGNSGGCFDYGGKAEKVTGYDLVEWIAKQKWSDGKVAMIGGSYEGTTAWAAAVMAPPHLTTIVPEAAIARWYDYAYENGIRYFDNSEAPREGPRAPADEGIDTPLAFDFGLAIPPPLDVDSPGWQQRVGERIRPCDQLQHTDKGYDDTPDYDKFWIERDYLLDAGNIRIPALIAANWGDWNVKQDESILMYHALRNSPNVKLYMGTAWEGHGVPGGAYGATVDAWMDHYLMGADNGIQDMPDVHSQLSDYGGATKNWYAGSWPKTTDVVLYAQETPVTSPNDYAWKLLPTKPHVTKGMPTDVAQFPSSNINTETHAAHHTRSNHDWFWFEAPAFSRDVRIFGQIKLQVYLDVARKWITVTPSILDIHHSSHVMVAGQHVASDKEALVGITRGWLDSRYRDGLGKQVLLKSNTFGLSVAMKPTDYTFIKGDQMGVNVQTEINEWSIPKPYPCDGPDCVLVKIDWTHAKTRLIIPVVGPVKNPLSLFDFSGV